MFDFVGDLISGIGGYFGAKETNKTNEKIAAQNAALQREFAQSGIQWKVADAKAAGLHPLAALGAQTASFSPSTVGAADMSEPFAKMGQGVGRAMKAAADATQRENRDEAEGRRLQLENQKLQNDVLRQRLASDQMRTSRLSGQIGPPMPSVSGDVPLPRPGPPRSASGYALSEDEMKQKPDDAPAQIGSRPFGYWLDHNPWFSDAQTGEDRYGESEVFSTVKGAVNLAGDHVYTGYNRLPGYIRDYFRTVGGASPSADYRRQFSRRVQGWR